MGGGATGESVKIAKEGGAAPGPRLVVERGAAWEGEGASAFLELLKALQDEGEPGGGLANIRATSDNTTTPQHT